MKIAAALALLILTGTAWTQQIPLDGIAHVGYRVRDSERTAAFYTGVLGLPRAFTAGDGTAFFKVNDQQYLEFTPGLNPQYDIRLTHIAFATSDIQSLQRLLQSRGMTPPNVAKDSSGALSFSVRAPEGTRIDFVSRDRLNSGKLRDARQISNHLQHVGVIVPREQLDPVLRYYRDVLGMQEFWRYEPKPGDLRLIKLLVPSQRRDIVELNDSVGAANASEYRFDAAHQLRSLRHSRRAPSCARAWR